MLRALDSQYGFNGDIIKYLEWSVAWCGLRHRPQKRDRIVGAVASDLHDQAAQDVLYAFHRFSQVPARSLVSTHHRVTLLEPIRWPEIGFSWPEPGPP